MKSKIAASIFQMKKYLPVLTLAVLLSGIVVSSFHHHHCTESSDNCTFCRLQQTFFSITIEPDIQDAVLHRPFSKSLVILNERITDPSQKLVCSSHAPPQDC
jgi:hypothetical protein